MAANFWKEENFFKLGTVYCFHTLWVENFDEIALFLTVKEIQALLCFFIFGENSKIQTGRHFWKEENFVNIGHRYFLDILWVENFDEIALSLTVKEIEAFLCF